MRLFLVFLGPISFTKNLKKKQTKNKNKKKKTNQQKWAQLSENRILELSKRNGKPAFRAGSKQRRINIHIYRNNITNINTKYQFGMHFLGIAQREKP